MTRRDSDHVFHDWRSRQEREGNQCKRNVKALHRDAPERLRCFGILLAPEIDDVLQEWHAQKEVGNDEGDDLSLT